MWGLIVAALVPLAGTQLPPTVPQWQPTYNMSQSTIVMPCNFTSWMGSEDVISKFGIVDYDWSNAKQLWAQGHPMDCEERLVEQAKRRKAAACPTACPFPRGCLRKSDCPHAKVWVYRNLVKALPWFTSVRQKLDDPQYSGFFLKFDPRRKVSPRPLQRCGRCGTELCKMGGQGHRVRPLYVRLKALMPNVETQGSEHHQRPDARVIGVVKQLYPRRLRAEAVGLSYYAVH